MTAEAGLRAALACALAAGCVKSGAYADTDERKAACLEALLKVAEDGAHALSVVLGYVQVACGSAFRQRYPCAAI